MDYSTPGSSVRGILQARISEWVAISFCANLPDPGIELSLMSPALAGFTTKATWKALSPYNSPPPFFSPMYMTSLPLSHGCTFYFLPSVSLIIELVALKIWLMYAILKKTLASHLSVHLESISWDSLFQFSTQMTTKKDSGREEPLQLPSHFHLIPTGNPLPGSENGGCKVSVGWE